MPSREPLTHGSVVLGGFKQMAGRTEVRVNGLEDRQEALSMAGRFEAL